MKSEIKKILIFLSAALCVLGMTSCERAEASGYSKSDILVIICIGLLLVVLFVIIYTASEIKKKIEYSEFSIKSDRIVSNAGVKKQATGPVNKEKNEIDDLELVAVITAAIAAAEGKSSDAFVVRSIRKANKNKWQRA